MTKIALADHVYRNTLPGAGAWDERMCLRCSGKGLLNEEFEDVDFNEPETRVCELCDGFGTVVRTLTIG